MFVSFIEIVTMLVVDIYHVMNAVQLVLSDMKFQSGKNSKSNDDKKIVYFIAV